MEQAAADFPTWLRMLRAAFMLSLRRLLRASALIPQALLAGIPLIIVGLIYLATWRHPKIVNIARVHSVYEGFLLRAIYLHFIVFFIANILGSSVMRQDREEQTLHYLFLQPVRRWMLVVGKFMAYFLVSSVLCVASLWAAYLALGLCFTNSREVVTDLFTQGRFEILLRESLVLMLGLLAYGAFALLMGNFFKNATYSILLLGWEVGLPYLPTTLKFWTISHYLQSLLPERLNEMKEMFALLGDFATPVHSYAVLLGLPVLFVGVSIWLFRYRECLYGET